MLTDIVPRGLSRGRAHARLAHARLALGMLALGALGGCLDVPHPFADPGEDAKRLALAPPPSRLDVPTPTDALLNPARAALWASVVGQAMLGQGVPAVAQPVRAGDWWLRISASAMGDRIVPHYAVMSPEGKRQGTQDGEPVAASAWGGGTAVVLDGTAQAAAPGLAHMLDGIQADMMDHDPHSLMHRPATIYFAGVTGAPGDGDTSLRTAFLGAIRDTRDALQDSPKGADYTVRTTVSIGPAPQGGASEPQQHVEIVWHVVDAHGTEAGAATQLHDVDAHSLDGAWGEIADAAAQEAAAGVRQIITNYSGRNAKPSATGQGPAPAPTRNQTRNQIQGPGSAPAPLAVSASHG